MEERQARIFSEATVEAYDEQMTSPLLSLEKLYPERRRITEHILAATAIDCNNPELQTRATLAARRLQMIEHAEAAYLSMLDKHPETNLWENQKVPYLKTLLFFTRTGPDIEDDTDLSRRGYLELPTAYGKTAITTNVLLALGVGTIGPEADPRPIRALWLTPTLPILKRTAGEQGILKFARDVRVSSFYSHEKDPSGDIVVTTYQSLQQKNTRALLADHQFDIVVCDEAHIVMGKQTRQAVESVMGDALTLGVTATSAYGKRRSIKSVLGHEIISKDVREAVHDGDINGAQLIGLWTGSRLSVPHDSESNDFTDKELHPLVRDTARNTLILDMASALVEQGRNVVIPSIGGNKNLHARLLEQYGSQRLVTDPVTGKKRPLVVRAVDMYSSDVSKILAQWERNEIDVLTYTDLLNQGWDSDRVDSMIMARPTRSAVLGRQRAGRGLRKSSANPLTVYVELYDDIDSDEGVYSIFHNFGEDLHANATIFAKDRQTMQRQRNTQFNLDGLPAALQDANKRLELVPIREAIIKVDPNRYSEAPAGWEPIALLAAEQQVWSSGLRKYLESKGFDCAVFARKGAPFAYYAPPAAVEFLSTYGLPPVAVAEAKVAKQIADHYGTTRERIIKGVQVLDIQGQERRSRKTGRVEIHYSKRDQQRLDAWLRETVVEESAQRTPISALERELAIGRQSIRHFLGTRGEDIIFAADKRTGANTGYLTPSQVKMVRERFGSTSAPPDGYEALRYIGERAGGHKLPRVRAIVKELGLEDRVQKYRHTPVGKKNAVFDTFLGAEDAERVAQRLAELAPPANAITVNAYASTRNSHSKRIHALVKKHNLPTISIDRGGLSNHYLPPRTEYALDKLTYQPLPAWYSRPKAVDIIRCRDEEFDSLLGYCKMQGAKVIGEEEIITTRVVEKLAQHTPDIQPFHHGWRNIGDIRDALLTTFNAQVSLKEIHEHIWQQMHPKTREFTLIRRADVLQFHYEPDFAQSVAQALRSRRKS